MDKIFLFDLDSTLTRVEILPEIAKIIGLEQKMQDLTEKTMNGELSFNESFRKRVGLLSDIPIAQVRKIIENVPLDENFINFIKKNRESCYVVTGNINVWIIDLIKKIGMEERFYSSRAEILGTKLGKITHIADKGEFTKSLKNKFIVSIGDGSNDIEMLKNSDIRIGYGGVRKIPKGLKDVATDIFTDSKSCIIFLQNI